MKKKQNNTDDESELLKDGQVLHVPMYAMDSVQRSVAASTMTDASLHRPGYRLSVKMTTDSAARNELQDIYDAYELDLTTRWQTPAAGPITSQVDDTALLDESFDDGADCYEMYDREIQERYRSK